MTVETGVAQTAAMQAVAAWTEYLQAEERSARTIEKYRRDVRRFALFAGGRPVDKALVLAYKEQLAGLYAVASANSMLAALNSFLRFTGRAACCVRQFRVQRQAFCPPERELTRGEYARLVQTARQRSGARLSLLMQAICATGIRVSEVRFITAEAARTGEAVVRCKGKTRVVLLPGALQKKLREYARARGIKAGPLFVTRTGKPLDRSNIWREMKALCAQAAVTPGKVFPHNLRHLFARMFYRLEHDIAKLADLLGHSSVNTTRIYIASTGAEHRREMEKLGLIL